MASSRRSRFIAIVIALAVVALCVSLWVNEGPLWRWVMCRKVEWQPNSSRSMRGWFTAKRWTQPPLAHGRAKVWHVSTGFKAIEYELENGAIMWATLWDQDGSVVLQKSHDLGTIVSPPWLWNVTDQTKPTAPFWDHEKNAPKDD